MKEIQSLFRYILERRLNGVYLKGLEQLEAKPFEQLELNYSKFGELENYFEKELSSDQVYRVNQLFKLIEGFETGLSLRKFFLLLGNYSLLNGQASTEKKLIYQLSV